LKKVSAIIITYNEKDNIAKCLNSIRWVDEIIIVDSLSEDGTVEICKKYTANIYKKAFTDFSEMKNFALSKATGDWVLSIDADEEVNDGLYAEIQERLKDETSDVDGYFIPRKSYIFKRWFNFSGTQDDFKMALFKRTKVRFYQPIHEIVHIEGKTTRLSNYLNHYTYPSISGYIKRFNFYTTLEAKFMYEKGIKPNGFSLYLKPLAMFIRLYIFKQGFRDGIEGFIFSVLSSFYVFTKYFKLYEQLNVKTD
jgi:glycosyltransferase involved in cell wall biosynthesis